MCIYVAENNLEFEFQLFLFLKFIYPNGKTKLSSTERQAIAQMMGYRTNKPLKSRLNQLQQLNWIRYNQATNYWIKHSFDRLRKWQGWSSRAGIVCYFKDLNRLFAFEGAAIFTYLHKDFWRKVWRSKVVRIKGRTYHSLSGSSRHKEGFAPVATTGVNALFNISITKASRLKNAAFAAGFIDLKKDLDRLPIDLKELKLFKKHHPDITNLIIRSEMVHLQLIDLVMPKIGLKRRRGLKT